MSWFRNDKQLLKDMSCSNHIVLLYNEEKYKGKCALYGMCVWIKEKP